VAKTEAELREAFTADPAHADAFIALRRIYQQEQRWGDLGEIYEARAAVMTEGAKAAELWTRAAEIRFDKLQDEEGGTRALLQAVKADPAQRRAAEKLKKLLKDQSRWEDYLQLLSDQAEAQGADPAQAGAVAKLHLEMGTLWEEHFARTDKAMYHYQQACRLDPRLVPALQAARRVYRQSGDWPTVARLLESELNVTAPALARFELLTTLAQVKSERLHDLAGAARSLQEALAAKPGELRALAALADLFSSADWPQEGGKVQAARLHVQIAQIHRTAKQADEAVASLRQALECDPDSREAFRLLEDVLTRTARYRALDEVYQERLARVTGVEAFDLYMKRGALLEEQLKDRAAAKQCYEAVLPHEAPGGPAAAMLCELYLDDGEFSRVAELKEAELEVIDDVGLRIARMLELALLYRDRLADEDKAGIYLHGVLQLDPNHAQALEHYRQHFRNKGDFRGLADLLAFSIESAIEARARKNVVVAQIRELAEICEERIGDLPRARETWQRLQQVDPTHIDAPEALRRLARKERMWSSLAGALDRELEAAVSPAERVETLLRIGQAHHEKGIDPLRGIEVLEQLLEEAPGEPTALGLLRDLYERENNWEGVATVIRRQLEVSDDPSERLEQLRALAMIYQDKLKQQRETGWACTQILELSPGDEDALRRLTEVLRELQDWPKLLRTLRYQAQTASDTEDRIRCWRTMADIALTKVEDAALAAEAWEGLRQLVPGDPEAVRQLTSLYERLGNWPALADLLESLAKDLAGGDEAALQGHLRRLARVADTRLGDPDRALEAWRSISEMQPDDKEALAALARLYYTQEDWESLVDVIARQIPLSDDPQKAVSLSLRQADLLEDKLDQPKAAIDLLERVLELYDPASHDTLTRLRRLYGTIGESAKSVRVAERQLALLEGEERIPVALVIAAAWRDEVGDDDQAMKAYERVLELDRSNAEALSALVVLYTRSGRWQELINANQLLFDLAADDRERLRLLYQIAEVCEERLEEPLKAFSWYRKAYQLYPQDRGTLTSLTRAAAQHGLWEELISVYEEMRARAQTPAEHLEAAGRIAEICEHRLEDPRRAFDVLRGALVVDLPGQELLPELERIGNATELWDGLVEVYERVIKHRRDASERVDILHRAAAILEDRLTDAKGTLQRLRRAFEIDSQDAKTQSWLLRVAESESSWPDVLDVYAAQYTQAASLEDKLDLIRQSAPVVEERLGDKVKSFRAWLHGFLMAPADEEIQAELWRLAGEIGDYPPEVTQADLEARKPKPAPKRDESRRFQRVSVPMRRLVDLGGGGGLERPEVTQEIDIAELEIMEEEPPLRPERADPTMEIRLQDLVEIHAVRTGQSQRIQASSLEVKLVDLMEVEGDGAVPGSRTAPEVSELVLKPPRSAWEEFARAYAMLPAPDTDAQIESCHHIARIWREGAKDLERTYVALRKALDLAPLRTETQEAIEDVSREARKVSRLAEAYQEIINDSHGVDLIIALNREASRLFREAGMPEAAEARLKEILSIKPDDPHAFEQLQEIYREQERWNDLAELDERQMDDLLERLPAGPEKEAKLRELAGLYEEKLDQPYEAMTVLGKLLQDLPDDLLAWRALARLAERTESWAKAVEALGQLQELTDDDGERRRVARRIAEVYRDELELADRAIEGFKRLVEDDGSDDEALRSLERLLEEHESWTELEEVLSRRAELASGPSWIALVRRRAQVLDEYLKAPGEAASTLKQIVEYLPGDDEVFSELVRLLRRAERSDEAAELLRERIDAGESAGAPRGEIASLLVRLAMVLSQDLTDSEAARNALGRALEVVPGYPSALTELARLHQREQDWVGYAAARRTEAESTTDEAAALAALLEAAAVYLDKLGDKARAKACLEQALVRQPDHLEILDRLGELAAVEKRWADARSFQLRRLEQLTEPGPRADVLTRIGQLELDGFGDEAQAAERFRAALELVPEHVPAIIALADLSYRNEKWDEAEAQLTAALNRLVGQPAMAAKLGYRLSTIFLRQSKIDEGFALLTDLNRQYASQFLIKLALGTNRYHARRWREAASILSALPDHPEAELYYRDEVAEACCLAADAEIHQRRPQKAPGLWETALKFKPDHMPAIHALVSYHTERGAIADAARYLRAQADATTAPAARVQLLDSLGDLYLEKLEDDAAAMGCFREALQAAETVEAQHLPILEKLFPLCRSLGEDAEAARVIGFILAFTEDPDLRLPREIQAADAFLSLGDPEKAREHLEHALALDPTNEQATVATVDLYEQTGQYREMAELLKAYLDRLAEASEESEWARRAALYEKLADTYRHGLENPRGALEALEKALELDPTRLSCRTILAELYGEAPEYAERAFLNNLALLAQDIRRPATLRSLGQVYRQRGDLDKTVCVHRLLDAMGVADLAELGFVAQHASPELRADELPPGVLREEDHRDCLAHPDTQIMSEVFSTLWEGAQPFFGQGLEALGISAQDRVSPVADMDLARVYGAAARVLGNRHAGLYLKWDGSVEGVRIACHAPPVILVGPDIEKRPLPELRFLLGRALELTRPEYILASGLEKTEFSQLFASVLRAFHPRHSRRRGDDSDAISRRAAQLKKDLPYRVSRKLVELMAAKAHVEFNSREWRLAVQHSGNRAGLLVSGDLRGAIRVILAEELDLGADALAGWTADQFSEYMERSTQLKDLCTFAVSEEYFRARKGLGVAVASNKT
jgi:tetratricopeptide (TPR) repeat protein